MSLKKFLKEKNKFFKSISSKKIRNLLLGSTVSIMLVIFGFYSGVKDAGKDLLQAFTPEPNYWYCEQDNNIRGIIFKNSDFKDYEYINVRVGNYQSTSSFSLPIERGLNAPSQCLFRINNSEENCNITFYISKNNEFIINANIYDSSECLVGKIKENKFVLNKNCQFTWNRDDFGFEIVDSNFNIVISLSYHPPNNIGFAGVFKNKKTEIFVIEDYIYSFPDKKVKDSLQEIISPQFEYFGKDWFGKRIEPLNFRKLHDSLFTKEKTTQKTQQIYKVKTDKGYTLGELLELMKNGEIEYEVIDTIMNERLDLEDMIQ